jgi:hypothetical protein
MTDQRSTHATRSRRRALTVAAVAIVGAGLLGVIRIGNADQPRPQDSEAKATKPSLDPRADALLKKMSSFMGKQQRFSVHSEGGLEVVLDDGQKLEFPFQSDLDVQRPNKLRAERRGAKTDLMMLYDGRQIVLYGKILNMFARSLAPATLDAAIDHARDVLGLDAPGADLLYSDAYAGLTPDLVSSMYLGPEMVKGVECEHAAFHGKEVDFQIWVRTGDSPTPCRYVVTTTGIDGKPEYAADFVNWNLSPQFAESTFTFRPPAGAEEIAFLTAEEMKRQAQHVKTGSLDKKQPQQTGGAR